MSVHSHDPVLWLNGSLVPAGSLCISAFDHGLTTGDGVFEAVISYGGIPFEMERHWLRLRASAAAMGLQVPEFSVLAEAVAQVLEDNGMRDARIRITVTGGVAPLGSEKGSSGETVVVAAAPLPQRPAVAKVVTVPWVRNERGALAGVKSTSYGENVRALAHAKAQGAQEAIFANTRGELCEGTGSNIFVLTEGRLVTPPLESGCLAGVTRAVVLDLCREMNLPVREEPVEMNILTTCTEAFLTSTFREVQAIGAMDGRILRDVPGALTRQIQEAFRAHVVRVCADRG
ncbi:MAG: aminotransferase class IV [Verrucomicrobiales bacterium]|nr:aminotransferase class IV [Verrucomicrobiales bacterium]